MGRREQLQWGVLGAANIAIAQMIPAIQQSQSGHLAAIASRDSEKSSELAKRFRIDRFYGSYDEILADPRVDAIYLPLPNHLHCEWSIKAAQAGKHVLCEKPLAMDVDECRRMIQAAASNDVLLVEAFWYRYHPQHQVVWEVLQEGRLGEIRVVSAYLRGNIYSLPTTIRFSREFGGGTLMDGGCYPVNLCRWICQREPKVVTAFFGFDPVHKVDITFNGVLDFGGNQYGVVQSLFHHGLRKSRYEVLGERGFLSIDPFLTADHGSATVRLWVNDQTSEYAVPPTNAFVSQVDAFADSLRDGKAPLTPAEDAVKNMTVIEALYRSGHTGRHVRLA